MIWNESYWSGHPSWRVMVRVSQSSLSLSLSLSLPPSSFWPSSSSRKKSHSDIKSTVSLIPSAWWSHLLSSPPIPPSDSISPSFPLLFSLHFFLLLFPHHVLRVFNWPSFPKGLCSLPVTIRYRYYKENHWWLLIFNDSHTLWTPPHTHTHKHRCMLFLNHMGGDEHRLYLHTHTQWSALEHAYTRVNTPLYVSLRPSLANICWHVYNFNRNPGMPLRCTHTASWVTLLPAAQLHCVCVCVCVLTALAQHESQTRFVLVVFFFHTPYSGLCTCFTWLRKGCVNMVGFYFFKCLFTFWVLLFWSNSTSQKSVS